jgi:hypothetical protein
MNQCCLKKWSSTWEGKEKSDLNGLLYILFWEGAKGGKMLWFAVLNCKLPFLLPASYFVVEIASIC